MVACRWKPFTKWPKRKPTWAFIHGSSETLLRLRNREAQFAKTDHRRLPCLSDFHFLSGAARQRNNKKKRITFTVCAKSRFNQICSMMKTSFKHYTMDFRAYGKIKLWKQWDESLPPVCSLYISEFTLKVPQSVPRLNRKLSEKNRKISDNQEHVNCFKLHKMNRQIKILLFLLNGVVSIKVDFSNRYRQL